MSIFGINLLGLFLATFSGMILGALWYSPLLFGNQWMASIGKTPETLGDTKLPMIGSVIASLLSALGVSIVFLFIGDVGLSSGISIGLVLGVLIIFPALLSDNLFCGWGNQLLLIQSGYRALSVLLMSVIWTFFA